MVSGGNLVRRYKGKAAFVERVWIGLMLIFPQRLNGLSFLLKQKQADGYWKTLMFCSRYLTGVEERYAMVELELLAIAWACKKTPTFTEGIKFTIVTDHKLFGPWLSFLARGHFFFALVNFLGLGQLFGLSLSLNLG